MPPASVGSSTLTLVLMMGQVLVPSKACGNLSLVALLLVVNCVRHLK